MTPSNDFRRESVRGWRERLPRAGALLAAASLAAGTVWTLGQVDEGIWPIVRAASAVSLDDWTTTGRGPRYGPGGLERPDGHERWVTVGASLGLGYSPNAGASPHQQFHQVRIEPSAYEAFVRTGVFPEGTMLALEIAAAGSRVLPVRGGLFADERVALELAVKDQRVSPDGWSYYSFGDGTRAAAQRLPSASCFTCHRTHAVTDNVFTQFYPRLRPTRE